MSTDPVQTPVSPNGSSSSCTSEGTRLARLLAFYLPQFHPIPENNRWWGNGFTEWTNVAQASTLFPGHYQPHLPADLGFYDLRLPEVRSAQAELARQHGIEGFCYWHYWFQGKRLLQRPFQEVLASGQPDFPFCLAWANESWSRRWLGEEKDILLAQTYTAEDDRRHIHWLMEAFADPRYIRVHNRPVLLIYRPLDLPHPQNTTDLFRKECLRAGLPEPYLVGINAHCPHLDCRQIGFDGTLNFKPQLGCLPDFMTDTATSGKFIRNLRCGTWSCRLKLYEYSVACELMQQRKHDFPVHPCVFVGFDNTPRRGKHAIIIVNSEPQMLEADLRNILNDLLGQPYEERFVWINAWNEWAEGNHLEPDVRQGFGYLQAVQRANVMLDNNQNDSVMHPTKT